MAEVAKLAGSRLAEKEFYQRFLELLPKPESVMGTAAWRVGSNEFQQIATSKNAQSPGFELRVSQGLYGQHLLQVVKTRRYHCLSPPASDEPNGQGQEAAAAPPGDAPARILTFPIVSGESVPVVIDVYTRNEDGITANSESFQHFVDQTTLLCAVAGLYYQTELTFQGTDAGVASLVQLASQVHQSLDGELICHALANETRRILGWDRVSILRRRGRHYRIQAISGQDSVNRRAIVVRAQEQLVDIVAPARAPFWYPNDGVDYADEVEAVLEDYLECSSVRRLGVIPIMPPARRPDVGLDDDEPAPAGRHELAPLGALVIEQLGDDLKSISEVEPMLMAVVEQGALALHNAAIHESIPMLSWMRFLGRQWEWIRGSGYRATCLTIAALVALGLFLSLWPADLNIRCEGKYMPSERRHVFAPESGVVADLWVNHGSEVQEGDLLLTLRNHDLSLALETLDGELAKVQSQLGALRAQRYAGSADRLTQEEKLAMAGEERSLQAYLQSLRAQQLLAKERLDALRITSPMAGKVLTWDLQDRIRDRPIERGQVLMEIARTDGPWEVQLRVPDQYVAELMDTTRPARGLPVTFLIASDVSREYHGTVEDVAMATALEPNQRQSIRVTVTAPSDRAMTDFQAGTSVQAKIHCGERPIGYVWFRDVWRFLYRNLIFRWL